MCPQFFPGYVTIVIALSIMLAITGVGVTAEEERGGCDCKDENNSRPPAKIRPCMKLHTLHWWPESRQ